ncbi:Pr6Pr family membrane protein [Mucilaginibacter sp. CAU 1740]|uniref:Pr6Pr family membrane protein n=1 Tax=Mucilaginibacter sp. CAU 1740 TaxID=3140365 RepID=UPI00325B5E7E
MNKHQSNNITAKLKLLLLISTVSIIWFALILQIAIAIPVHLAQGRSLGGTLVLLFSYFTILINLLAAISLSVIVLKPKSNGAVYFLQSHVFAGITLYITIVGLTYNLVLRQLWQPVGLFKLADELLHSVDPLLFVICWLLFAPKTVLKWKQALNWLWVPFIYSVYIFIRGAISHLYPYPFMDIDKFGIQQVIINSGFMLIAFLVIGLLLVWINNIIAKR